MANKFVQDIEILDKVAKLKVSDRKNNQRGFAIHKDLGTSGTPIKVNASASPAGEIAPEESVKEEPKVVTSVSAPALTQEQIEALINNSIATKIEPLKNELEESKQAIAIEAEQKNQLQQQLEAIAREKEELKNQLEEAQKAAKTLEDLGKLQGKTNGFPSVNTITSSRSDKVDGAYKDFLDVRNSLPVVYKFDKSGNQFPAYDNRELNSFTKKNLNAVIADAERWGRKNGLFKGTAVTNAATVGADIIGGFLPVLSAIMRQNNRPGFVWWQFPTTRIEFQKGEGDTVRIPRAAYQPRATTKNDRLLSGNGVYTRIDSGSQNLSTGTINAVLEEYGLGRNSTYPPIMVANFTAAYSMIELLAILQRNIGYDYFSWENTTIREMFIPTSRVVYNKRDAVVTAPGSIVAGDGAQCTRRYLRALSGYMKELQIPPFMNQKHVLVLPSSNVTQLSQDMDKFWAAPTPDALMALTNVLNPSLIAPSETERITGYVGDIEGFMIFEDNDYGVGAAGSPGVRTQAIAGNTVTTRSGYAFGADATGRGIGTEMELRYDEITDFGRSTRVIWRSEESFVPMDVDPVGYNDTSSVPQQLRVLEARFSDVAV